MFTIVFTMECVLKIIAMGFSGNTDSYINDRWNMLDFVVVVTRYAVCGVWYVVCGVWYAVCGVWCVVCGMRCVVCGMRCVVCGVRCEGCGMWYVLMSSGPRLTPPAPSPPHTTPQFGRGCPRHAQRLSSPYLSCVTSVACNVIHTGTSEYCGDDAQLTARAR